MPDPWVADVSGVICTLQRRVRQLELALQAARGQGHAGGALLMLTNGEDLGGATSQSPPSSAAPTSEALLQGQLDELEARHRELRVENENFSRQLREATARGDEFEAQYRDMRARNESLSQRLSKANERAMNLEQEYNEVVLAHNERVQERDSFQKSAEDLNKDTHKLMEDNDRLEEQLQKLQAKCAEAEQRGEELEGRLHEAEERRRRAEEEAEVRNGS
jgi:chromosome segregation ATPase